MPVYGKEKNKQMGRSILPSTARKQIRKRKDGLHRHNRRTINNSLHVLRGQAGDVVDDYEDDTTDFEFYGEPHRCDYGGWGDIVFDRRMADHLNHFEVWAYERTKHMRPQDRWSKISTMIDGDLIGYHAMTHLEFLKHDPLDRDSWHDNLPTRYRRQHYRNNYVTERKRIRNKVENAIRGICRDDVKRKKLNSYLTKHAGRDVMVVRRIDFSNLDKTYKYAHIYKRYEEEIVFEGVRTLNGYHDATKFINDIFATQTNNPALGYHPSWLRCVKEYFDIK